jgi:pilus assembly protein Flp/PilA
MYSAPSTAASQAFDPLVPPNKKRPCQRTGLLFQGFIPEILWKEVSSMLVTVKEKGQGLVEYALILVLVAIVVIAVLMLLGPIIGNVFSTLNSSLSGV